MTAPADGNLVSSTQLKIRDDFSQVVQPRQWLTMKLGSGMSIDWSSQPSAMRIITGTTANSETVLRLDQPFGTPVRAMFLALGAALLSQRIANQEFELRLASADGTEYVSWLFDGTTATSAKQRSANQNVAAADAAVTVVDTGNGSAAFELESWMDECYWHARSADSTNARAQSYVRNRRIPDPNTPLYLEIVARNLATAPASSTTLSFDAVTVQDITELSAEITGGRGGGASSQGVTVVPAGGTMVVNANGSDVNPRIITRSDEPVYSTALTASQNYVQGTVDLSTAIQSRPTRHRVVCNANSTVFTPVTLALEESADNVTFRETWRASIPIDGGYHTFDVPQHLRYYRWRAINNVATAGTGFWLSDQLVHGEGATSDIDRTLTYPVTAAAGQALALSTAFTSPAIDLGQNHQWERVRALVKSDQASTASLVLQQSMDGVNWFAPDPAATLAANVPQLLEQRIVGRYARLVVTNGAVAATAFFAALALVSL